MNIGLRIKGLRDEKKMSQEELADKIGVSKQMVSHYENGTNVPRGAKIKLLAKVFGISEEEFYTSKSTSNLTEQEKEWLAEKNRLLLKIDQLHDKLLDISEKKLESLDDATREIITLNAEVRDLRKKINGE
jgi:transcriptional regulator with XRE-family HTH domain